MSPDDDLMERLRRIAVEVDPPPAHVTAAALAALSTRRLDEELAELVMDSELLDSGHVRAGGDGVRLLSFESAAVSVELQVEEGASLRGLVAGAVGEVVVETPSGVRGVPLDEDGWFVVEPVPVGVVRFRLRAVDGSSVTSAWVSL